MTMVGLLDVDVDASSFDAAMLFLDDFVASDHNPIVPAYEQLHQPLAIATHVGPTMTPTPTFPADLTAHLLDEHALLSGLPTPSFCLSPSSVMTPVPPPVPSSPLRIVPLAVDYFPLGVDFDGPIFATAVPPITPPPFFPMAITPLNAPLAGPIVKKPTKKPKRPPTYNSNKAREERRQELLYLRRKVVDMEEELGRLSEKRARYVSACLLASDSSPPTSRSPTATTATTEPRKPSVWEEIAAHQLEERRRAERENEQLKVVLETQLKIAKSLESILNKRSTLRGMEASGLGKRKRVFANTASQTDKVIFDELLLGVERCYLEIEGLFDRLQIGPLESSFRDARMCDGENGMYMEIYANNVLPFTVHTAGQAAWKYFAQNINHLPFRQYYERIREDEFVTEDTIVENIGLELWANNTKALFRLKQVLRRYVEEDRVVIVWTSIIDPIEFAEKPFTGCYFCESGYMLLKKPKTYDPAGYSVLKTCYVITPEFSSGCKFDEGDEIIGQLTDFVLSGTAASIAASHQVIENMLLSEALKKPATTTAAPAPATSAV